MDNRTKLIAERVAAILFWVAVWLCAAFCVDNSILLAGPAETVEALCADLSSAAFWAAIGRSAASILAAALASSAVGALFGFAAARWHAVEVLLAPVVQVMKSVPVACVVVILLVVVGSQGAIPVIVAFVAFPPFYVAAGQAASHRESDEASVLRLMGASGKQVFLACTWPAVLPFFQTAAKTSMGLAWRAGITGELLGIPLESIGASIYVSKLTLDTAGLLAWTIVIMLLAWVSERVAVWLLGLTALSPRLALRGKPADADADADGRALRALLRRSASHPPVRGEEGVPVAPVAVELDAVSKAYGEQMVLEAIGLQVLEGERLCLMAPTGEGKTTLLRILLGIDQPDAGAVSRPDLCGIVLQEPTLVENLTALENVLLVSRVGSSEVSAPLRRLLPDGCSDKLARELSGGTRRLTEIARALFSPGELIVLDEPFTGLDVAARQRACAFISEQLHGRTLIVTTHNDEDAALLGAANIPLP